MNKLLKMCKRTPMYCAVALLLVAYIALQTPATTLDLFSTNWGKGLSMTLVMVSLLFDVKFGALLGFAVVMSIALASVNKDLKESYEETSEKVALTDESLTKKSLKAELDAHVAESKAHHSHKTVTREREEGDAALSNQIMELRHDLNLHTHAQAAKY